VRRASLDATAARAAATNASELAKVPVAQGEGAAATGGEPPEDASASNVPSSSATSASAGAEAVGPKAGKPAAGGGGVKILHMTHNPAQNAQQATIDGLRAKVHSLQMQLELAKECQAMATADAAKGGETATPSASQLQAIVAAAQSADLLAAQSEVDELRRTVSDLTIEKERLKQVFQNSIKQFRETVIKITGYRVDQLPYGSMNVYNVYFYDHNRHEPLKFRLDEKGERQVQLLESPLMQRLLADSPDLNKHLSGGHFGAFLAAVMLMLIEQAPMATGHHVG